MAQTKSKRIFYFDALRAFAIIAVMLIHVFNTTQTLAAPGYATIPSLKWFVSCFLGATFRVGVPLFLMLSGALTLGRVWDIKSFLKKRLPRVVIPFVFWGFVMSVVVVLAAHYFNLFDTIDPVNIGNFLHYLYDSYMADNKGFTSLWFFWMILGIYLIAPIFNKWVFNSGLEEVEYFLVLWLITCIFDFTLFVDFPIKLTYFSGPIGLFVAGYYFANTKRKIFNSPYWAIVICLVGFLLAVLSMYLLSNTKEFFVMDRYSLMNVVLAIGIFLLFRNFSKFNFHPKFIYDSDGWFRKIVLILATYSYGMYLVHRALLAIFNTYFRHELSYGPLVIVTFLLTFFTTWAIMAICNRIPYLNELIGVK